MTLREHSGEIPCKSELAGRRSTQRAPAKLQRAGTPLHPKMGINRVNVAEGPLNDVGVGQAVSSVKVVDQIDRPHAGQAGEGYIAPNSRAHLGFKRITPASSIVEFKGVARNQGFSTVDKRRSLGNLELHDLAIDESGTSELGGWLAARPRSQVFKRAARNPEGGRDQVVGKHVPQG